MAQFNTFISDRIVSNLKAISASLLVLHKRCYVTQIDQIDVLVTPWLLFYSLSFVWSSSGASPRYAKGRASPLCVKQTLLTHSWVGEGACCCPQSAGGLGRSHQLERHHSLLPKSTQGASSLQGSFLSVTEGAHREMAVGLFTTVKGSCLMERHWKPYI